MRRDGGCLCCGFCIIWSSLVYCWCKVGEWDDGDIWDDEWCLIWWG